MKAASETIKTGLAFPVTERQGSKTAFGDIRVGSLKRYIYAAAKRGWVMTREYQLFCLAEAEISKRAAYVPDDHRIRDILTDKDAEQLIGLATTLSTKMIPEGEEKVAANG